MKSISAALIVYMVSLICWAGGDPAQSQLQAWKQKQAGITFDLLLENISRKDTPRGFIVASPSKVSPNYYYHWVRDAALVMRAIDKHLPEGQQKDSLFSDYIDLVLHHQSAKALTGLGEPKFNPDGSSYAGPWGRPQNDGPALRAITLIHHANSLLDRGEKSLVLAKLYSNNLPANSAIKRDLEYVSHNWQNPDFDLWEEVKGTHFYTRMVQRTAMLMGARLALRLGDEGAADWYQKQFQQINQQLDWHWSVKRGYILTTIDRVGGLHYKDSGLDTSVILAVNHAWMPGLSFGPHDPRVSKTYSALVDAFKKVYTINDDGTAIGRYPEDTYYGGNPWFLLTHAMAEYLFSIGKNSEANTYLMRTRRHFDAASGRMSEQFDRNTGVMLGARDLTWSYASFLTAIQNEN